MSKTANKLDNNLLEEVDDGLKLDEASLQFIAEMGIYFKRYGLTRIAGDIWGLLLLAKRPLSVDEIAVLLHVSRTAIVTNLQTLQAVALVELAPRRRGDRREFYQIGTDSWENVMTSGVQRSEILLDKTRSGLKIIAPDNTEAYERFKQMEAFFEFFLEWADDFVKAWEKRKAELNFD